MNWVGALETRESLSDDEREEIANGLQTETFDLLTVKNEEEY